MSTITSSPLNRHSTSSYQSLLLCVCVSTTTQAPAFLLICFFIFFPPPRSLSCFLPAQHFSVFSQVLSSFSNPRVTALPGIPVVQIIIPNDAKFKCPEGSVLQYQIISKEKKKYLLLFVFKGKMFSVNWSLSNFANSRLNYLVFNQLRIHVSPVFFFYSALYHLFYYHFCIKLALFF